MKKQLPVLILAFISICLGLALFSAKQDVQLLKSELADAPRQKNAPAASADKALAPDPVEEAVAETPAIAEAIVAAPEENDANRRMMSNLSKMMENPTMNKVMEASQRGAVGALYSDMIEYLGLDADETKYFMDLLMFRQMKQIDLSMKMMSGSMTPEEKKQMQAELREASETVKTEMENFLNNPDDYAEFEFYEKTMGERMMLSQMDKSLANSEAALSDDAFRGLLDMMHSERESFRFNSDLNDETNTDISPERFSKENVQAFASDLDQLNLAIIQRAQSMLTPEQLAAFEQAIKTTSEMQKAQLEMAAQMMGQKK